MQNKKKWYQSKTIVIAILQGVFGVIVAFETTSPELQGVGALAIVKSLIDTIIRMQTNTGVE